MKSYVLIFAALVAISFIADAQASVVYYGSSYGNYRYVPSQSPSRQFYFNYDSSSSYFSVGYNSGYYPYRGYGYAHYGMPSYAYGNAYGYDYGYPYGYYGNSYCVTRCYYVGGLRQCGCY